MAKVACAVSPFVRDLVQQLEGSNLVVHIESSRQLPSGVSGTMRFVTSRDGYRYVRISLAADARPESRTVMLGHELQHDCVLAGGDRGGSLPGPGAAQNNSPRPWPRGGSLH